MSIITIIYKKSEKLLEEDFLNEGNMEKFKEVDFDTCKLDREQLEKFLYIFKEVPYQGKYRVMTKNGIFYKQWECNISFERKDSILNALLQVKNIKMKQIIEYYY